MSVSKRTVQVKKRNTYEKRLGQGEDLVFRQESVLVLVMEIKEPLDVFHEIVEHNTIQSRHEILITSVSYLYRLLKLQY